MTSTLLPSSPPSSQSQGWKTWVVPAIMLREFINQHKHVWQRRYSPPHQDSDYHATTVPNDRFGWRSHLALEVSVFTGKSLEAVHRHLYRAMSGESTIIHAEFADAVVMSLGLDIDRDTSIPVLPGNLRNVQELLEIRDPKYWKRPEEERVRLQRVVMRLCGMIVANPRRLVHYQNDAPFDCLRPPK